MFSSSPRGTPIRRQSSAIEHIPFSTNLSHLSVELARTDSAASSPCRSEVSSLGGLSIRDQEQQKKSLEEENFKLKLRVYMLEERLQRQDSNEGSTKALAELRVQSAALREELTQKSSLLRRASDTLDVLEQRQSEQQARLRQDQAERALLEDTLEELEAQYRAELEQHEVTEAERQQLEGVLQALQAEQRQAGVLSAGRLQQRCERAEQEAERTAAALTSLRHCHAEERRRRERTEQERAQAEEQRSKAEEERSRLDNDLRRLQQRHSEEARRRERLAEENSRLQNLINSLRPQEGPQKPETWQELRATTAQNQPSAGAGAGAARLQAVAGERRLEQAVAAAALQLQTERARSLQATVHSLAEQLRRGQAELAQCRAERDRLLLQQQGTQWRESSASEAALSSTVGVKVILEPQSAAGSREELLQSCESPCTDLAAWLGSMPRLRSDSAEESAGRLPGEELPEGGAEEPPAVWLTSSQTQEAFQASVWRLAPGLAADNSDCDTWSEPDRSVSQARIGLQRSSLEPPTEVTIDTDTRTGRRNQRQASAELRDMDGRIEGLRQVRDGLWAEVAICQKLVTASGGTREQQGVTVPAELLEDVQQLHRRLEEAVTASDRLCCQREAEQRSPPPPELTLALTITQEELAESAQKLAAAQQRTKRLRTRLQQVGDKLRLVDQHRQQLDQQRHETAQEISTLTERLEQTEAERDRLAEAAHHQSDQQESGASLRWLRQQLERSSRRQQQLEELVRQLSGQLPAPGGEEKRAWRAEQQLLMLGRQRLRLQAEITRLRSRARLLHSQESVRESQQAEEAAAAAAGQTGRQQQQPPLASRQQRQQQLRHQSSSAAGAVESRTIKQLTQQLEKALGEIERMRAKAQEYDDASHSCPESIHSCEELPLALPSSPCRRPRLSSYYESDPHPEPLHTSCGGQPTYSSPDLGIESDCQHCSSRTSSTTVQSQRSEAADRTPLPSGGEETPVAGVGAVDLSTLAATRTALQQALRQLGRAEHSKAAMQSAVYRGLGQTQLLVSRASGGLRRPAAEAGVPSER